MKNVIHQFMWGFQQHFRHGVDYAVRNIMAHVGLQTNNQVKVMLIGFATRDSLRHKVCIEPEDGPLVIDDLRSVEKRTEEIRRADPEADVFDTNPRVHEARMRGLLLRSRAYALAEAIEASGKFEGLSFFVSGSAPIAGYEVHTCIGIPSDSLEAVPSFNNPKKDDYHGRHTETSFVQAIIHTCLNRADRALYLPNPGEGMGELGNTLDIVRSSAERFVQGVPFVLSGMPNDLFALVSKIASLTYERSGAKGRLAIMKQDNLNNKLNVRLESPVPLSETRSMRKLLELTDDSTFLFADYGAVYGLGECNSAPDVAEITIEGHASWSLAIDGKTLLRVNYEHATLPKQILDKNFFKDIAERTVDAVEVERIWEIVQCALESGHGTTIVVSADPISEINRLGHQALPIKPEYLEHGEVVRLGRVDGAIVLGPDGRCYAFGVILDGLATASGDRARGARFNSSVRYQQTSQVGTMVIVISDDGTVDIVPNLMPRVWRQEVEDAVQAFCEYSGIENSAGEEWARRNDKVKTLQFYLNQEQCDRVNESYEKEMDCRLEAGGIKMMRDGLRPNVDMNDSFFLDK